MVSRFLPRDAIELIGRIEHMIEHQPQASRVVKEDQREDDCKRYPQRELLVDRDAGESI